MKEGIVVDDDDDLPAGETTSEIERRRDAALLRALSTPHKRQKEMKVGKRAPKVRAKGKDGG
jgi:hypothetical protein